MVTVRPCAPEADATIGAGLAVLAAQPLTTRKTVRTQHCDARVPSASPPGPLTAALGTHMRLSTQTVRW